MTDSLNKIMLIGNLGNDPEIIEYSKGAGSLAAFSLATSHSWVDNKTNERKTKTDWHRIVVYGDSLIGIIKKLNIKKGTKLYIEGKLVNRKWVDKDGKNRVTTEIVLQGYNCTLIVLSSGSSNQNYNENNDKKNENVSDLGSDKYKKEGDDEFDSFLNESFDHLDDDKLLF
jgi:single-strand DNA-binding protein